MLHGSFRILIPLRYVLTDMDVTYKLEDNLQCTDRKRTAYADYLDGF